MKKILFLGCLMLTIAACQKKTTPGGDNDTINNDSPATTNSFKEGAAATCKPTVVIDKSLMTPAEYLNWEQKNSSYICQDLVDGNAIPVDLSGMENDSNNSKKAKWLEDNGTFINYTLSEPYILNNHTVSSEGVTVISTQKISVGDIKSVITASIYNNDKFNKYVQVEVGSEVVLEVVEDFQPGGGTFSVPFFRAIIQNLPDTTQINFSNVTVSQGGRNASAIYITSPAHTDKDFDTTTWP